MDVLVDAFAEAGGALREVIESPSRKAVDVSPRHALFLAARCWTDFGYIDIGEAVGKRDHTTAMHGVSEAAASLWCDLAPIKEILVRHDLYKKYEYDRVLFKDLIEAGARNMQNRMPGFKMDDFSLQAHGERFLETGLMTVHETGSKQNAKIAVRFPLAGSLFRVSDLTA